MAQPVWVLSVDLQAKTATFQSGMSDAAKSARGAFNDIKQGSGEVAGHVSTNMFASRHAVMAVTESLGVQMPRAITALLVHIGPLGAALEAAFPFLAIGLAAVLLIEHLAKLQQEGHALTEDQVRFGTAVQTAFNTLDQHLLQSQIRTDELRNDHLGALHHQIQLINAQSLQELVHQFSEVSRTADTVFARLQNHWYTFGEGARGAKNAMEDFQVGYAALEAKSDKKGASKFLEGTLESAEKALAKLKEVTTAQTVLRAASALPMGGAIVDAVSGGVDHGKTQEITAQQKFLELLRAQQEIEHKGSDGTKQDVLNAKLTAAKAANAISAEGARSAAEHQTKMAEIALSGEKTQAEAELGVHEATITERLALDTRLSEEEYRIQVIGNQKLIDALDKGGNDFNNQLQGLHQKAEELTAQHNVTLGNLEVKAKEESYRLALTKLTQAETEAIEATDRGGRERLAAIDAALKEEQSKNLQNTAFYRELQKQRVEVLRQTIAEEAKLTAEAGKQSAEHDEKMGELALAMDRQNQALRDSSHRVTIQQRLAEELKAANDEHALKLAAVQQEGATLDKSAKDYQNKLKANQDKELQLVKAHENELTAIKSTAEIERNKKILSAEAAFNDTVTAGLTQVLMGHKSFASMMGSLGNEVASGMLQNAIKAIEANLMSKESVAAKAARTAYNIGLTEGGPAGFILGPVMAAIAFSGVSAYQMGTDRVPGIGSGDTVPAMLAPGEGVVPGGVMDNLRAMARSGTMGGGTTYAAHVAPVYNLQALDTAGMEKMLEKHNDSIQKHVTNELRKMNR